jgi:hypothetical protein
MAIYASSIIIIFDGIRFFYYLHCYIYEQLFSGKPAVCKDAGFHEHVDQSCQQHCSLDLYLLLPHISPEMRAIKISL